MQIRKYTKQLLALSLAGLTVLATAPVSMAEVASANIGSVSAVGSVELRGVGVSEGTLFSGDRVNVGKGAYAKVVLGTGSKLELDGSSDVTVSKDGDAINIEMKSGNIAFTGAEKPVHVRVGAYEITAAKNARGTVAFVGSTALGVRVIDGSVSVRNATTKKSFTLQKGTEQIVSLTDSTQTGTVRLASSGLPSSIPAAPSMPRKQSGGLKTALLVATVVGSAGAIAVLMSKNDDSDSDAAARLRLVTAAQTLSNVSTTATQAATAATQVDASITAANIALNAAVATATNPATGFTATEKAALVARGATLSSAAKASQTAIATLNAQLINLQNALGNANASTATQIEAQIATILNSTNAEVAKLNQYIADLNKLVADANAEVPNLIPAPAIQPVTPAAPASGSNPA